MNNMICAGFDLVASNGATLQTNGSVEVVPGRVVSVANSDADVTITTLGIDGLETVVGVPSGVAYSGQFPLFTQVTFAITGDFSFGIYG